MKLLFLNTFSAKCKIQGVSWTNSWTKMIMGFTFLFLMYLPAVAQVKTQTDSTSTVLSNPVFIAFSIVAIILAIVIIAFTEVVKAAAHLRIEKEKIKKTDGTGIVKVLLILFVFTGFCNSLQSQNIAAAQLEKADSFFYFGIGAYVFYLMVLIITIELIVIFWLYLYSIHLLGIREVRRKLVEENIKLGIKKPSIIEKMNASVAIEKEVDIMFDHNYDGIRELDNDLPPWWKYGFYLTIIVAVAYFIHFHVSNTGNLPLAEYELQLAQGKRDVEAFRKKSANLVDENNATKLTDNESLTSGKLIFETNCVACHGKAGEGNAVGPNLTDDYWLHNGGIKDIFKTIKYGWPEKGMKSWQQDLGARQIHQVSSYIKSLSGTNPPNAREKQGELYLEESMPNPAKVSNEDSLSIQVK